MFVLHYYFVPYLIIRQCSFMNMIDMLFVVVVGNNTQNVISWTTILHLLCSAHQHAFYFDFSVNFM